MSAVEDCDLVEDEDGQLTLSSEEDRRRRLETPAQRRRRLGAERSARAREKKKNGKPSYRKLAVSQPGGLPYVIVPEIAPHLSRLAELAGKEAGVREGVDGDQLGTTVLAARAAIILKQNPEAVNRRLYSVLHKKQLFVNAQFVEACLMAMDAEHEVQYGEWPSSKAAALERVSIEAECKGKKPLPETLLARAERLYYKGLKKAYRRVGEVTP